MKTAKGTKAAILKTCHQTRISKWNKKKLQRKELHNIAHSQDREKTTKTIPVIKKLGKKTIKDKTKVIQGQAAKTFIRTELPISTAEFSANWNYLKSIIQPTKPNRPPNKRKKIDVQEKKNMIAAITTDTKQIGNEIWFDDVDPVLIEKKVTDDNRDVKDEQNSLITPNTTEELTKAVAMDCEMVGVGKNGVDSVLARVSIVNQHGHCLYDKFVKPQERVTDFRTHVSGVRPFNLKTAENFAVVQAEVNNIISGRILVGHAVHNDLKVLFLDHPRKKIRDTSKYKPFRQLTGGRNPALRTLTAKVLGIKIQDGEHNSIQDAQAAMRLYMMHRKRWEQDLKIQHPYKKNSRVKKVS